MSTNLDEFIAFPSIGQYRNVIKNIKSQSQFKGIDADGKPIIDRQATSPTLNYRGYVKLHGTNAAVVSNPDGTYYPQSRKRVLAVDADNFSFADFVINRVGDGWHDLFGSIAVSLDQDLSDSKIAVYGEWCGPGIQKNVALAELADKYFVIFAIKIISPEKSRWIPLGSISPDIVCPHPRIKLISDFPFYQLTIDFEKPSLVQNTLGEITNRVEECCPVAKALGEIEGIGEGVVWTCIDEDLYDEAYWFKVKGEKHSVSNVKTLAEVDPELVKSANEFIDLTVTENRLQQGIQVLKEDNVELSIKSTGVFLKWVYQDILKEESDVLEASQLDSKSIGGPISKKAKDWWFKWLEEN